jgi:hypothetical protein
MKTGAAEDRERALIRRGYTRTACGVCGFR